MAEISNLWYKLNAELFPVHYAWLDSRELSPEQAGSWDTNAPRNVKGEQGPGGMARAEEKESQLYTENNGMDTL